MVSLYLLIPLSLMLFVIGIWAVRYAVKSNQFEDLDNAAQRVILDDRQERRQTLTNNHSSNKSQKNNLDKTPDSKSDTFKSTTQSSDRSSTES